MAICKDQLETAQSRLQTATAAGSQSDVAALTVKIHDVEEKRKKWMVSPPSIHNTFKLSSNDPMILLV